MKKLLLTVVITALPLTVNAYGLSRMEASMIKASNFPAFQEATDIMETADEHQVNKVKAHHIHLSKKYLSKKYREWLHREEKPEREK